MTPEEFAKWQAEHAKSMSDGMCFGCPGHTLGTKALYEKMKVENDQAISKVVLDAMATVDRMMNDISDKIR